MILLSFVLAAVAATPPAPAAPSTDGKVTRAVARLSPTKGHEATGTVTFEKVGDEIRVTTVVTGLTAGEHGFHIHEKGDCSAPDATSAGGHFNPTGQSHAGRDAKGRHAGDLGNLKADTAGRASAELKDHHLKLEGDGSILGRAVIVHEKRDDLKTQPTGDAGARVACGVIESETSGTHP